MRYSACIMQVLIPPIVAILAAASFFLLYRSGRLAVGIWIALYVIVFSCGLLVGLNGYVGALVAIVLFIPPAAMHVRICQKILQLSRVNHPEEWKTIGGSVLEIGIFRADDRDFGDPQIALLKRESRWWCYAAVGGLLLILPTLLLIK